MVGSTSHKLVAFAPAALAFSACAVLGACNALNGSGDLELKGGTDASPSGRDATTLADGEIVENGDGAVDAPGSLVDGPTSTGPCDRNKPFLAPVLLAVSSMTDDDDGARLSPDELTMYFSSDRGASSDIYIATRSTVNVDFGAPALLPGVNTNAEERFPSVRGDGLVLYAKVVGGTGGQGAGDVFVATRNSTNDPFGALVVAATINGASDDGNPFIRADGAVLYFGSTRSGGTDIYRTSPGSNNAFSVPALVSELATSSNDTSPVVTPDDLAIYFASARGGTGGKGGRDVFVARRASASVPFTTPTLVAELSSSSDDLPTWVSADECRLYLTSDRAGTLDIYLARRSP